MRLHIGAAAALGAHEATLGEGRQRPSHGVAIDAIGFGDFGFARQPLAGSKCPVGNSTLDPVGNLPPQCDTVGGVLHAHGAATPWWEVRKIMRLSRNLHGASLSSCLLS